MRKLQWTGWLVKFIIIFLYIDNVCLLEKKFPTYCTTTLNICVKKRSMDECVVLCVKLIDREQRNKNSHFRKESFKNWIVSAENNHHNSNNNNKHWKLTSSTLYWMRFNLNLIYVLGSVASLVPRWSYVILTQACERISN